jgi:hypothetical protein
MVERTINLHFVPTSLLLLLSKDKCKVMVLHNMKAYGAIRGVPPLILNYGTKMEGCGQLHIPAALSLEGELQFLLNGRGWVVTRAGLDILEQGETSCASQIQPSFSVEHSALVALSGCKVAVALQCNK